MSEKIAKIVRYWSGDRDLKIGRIGSTAVRRVVSTLPLLGWDQIILGGDLSEKMVKTAA